MNGGGGKRPRPRWIWYAVGALILVVGSTLFWAFGQGGGGGDLTTLISGPELSKSSATFQVSGSDGVTFRCQLDGDPEQVCETGATFSGLADGQHELKAWAVDASGNAGEADTWTWTVDETPPEITLDGPEGATTETSATIHISINEPVESWICKLNSDPVPCTTTIATLTDLPARQQIFRVHATDLAGNEAETERWDWEVVAGTTVPTNTVLPSFTCSDTTCDALPGSWDGNPTGYEYFWLQNCNAAGTPADCHETPITGQQVGVLCGYVRLGVIAKSAAGDSAPAFSDPQQYIPECIE